ncbi:hypothetical protein KP509_29G019000 [Ceratopteris richardii]|nr:hypothetical protein KP509_29G019000 [Ceratopteris richardii]
MGASFDQGEDGRLHLAREGGHSHHRIVHAADVTGREIERALLDSVVRTPNITMFEHHFALDFLAHQEGATVTCHGVDTLDAVTGKVKRLIAGVTMLGAGGAGHIYVNTTNPLVATGDGVAMAHRAHAVISNMEFVQFHPTSLADEGLPVKPKDRHNAFLITEAVRGAGGILYNQAMERFMPWYDNRAELAPRDVVARSIDDQLKKRKESYVLLDISHKSREEILSHFPNIAAHCLKYGLDITKHPIPVVPAAHYMCGGVQTNLDGETSVKGLYAAGEVACTGLHGANRLGSNSMLEALVFAQRAVKPTIAYVQKLAGSHHAITEKAEWPRPKSLSSLIKEVVDDILNLTALKRRKMQEIMWEHVGLIRSTESLKTAQKKLCELQLDWEDEMYQKGWRPNMVHVKVCELRNLFLVSNLVVSSALARQESRGSHYVVDFPDLVESKRIPTKLFSTSSVHWQKYSGKDAVICIAE